MNSKSMPRIVLDAFIVLSIWSPVRGLLSFPFNLHIATVAPIRAKSQLKLSYFEA